MRDYTQSDPGCYHSMLNYLSQITGISTTKEMEITDISQVKRFSHNVHFILNGKELGQLQKIYRKGGIPMYTDVKTRTLDIPPNTKFDRIYEVVSRHYQEFNYPVDKAGSYKDSLGGGWSSNVQMYKVDNQYFAMMDCSC